LCGVIVQPVLLEPATWLAHVFDFDGRPLPDKVDATWLARCRALIGRRHAVLIRSLDEDGWFEPLVLEPDEEGAEAERGQAPVAAGEPGGGEASAEEAVSDKRRGDKRPGDERPGEDEPGDEGSDNKGSQAPQSDGQTGDVPDPEFGLGPVSRSLMPWVAGFQHANASFPDLEEMDDDSVAAALARIYRHLPADTDQERELVETLDREHPLDSLDEAIADVVAAVADLYDLTRELRYKVETVRRETPKVGRNDPCPCGSGKKFKQCHGAA